MVKKDPKRPLLVVKGKPVRYKKDFYMGLGSTRGDITWIGGMGADDPPEEPFVISFVTTYNFFAEIATKESHVTRQTRPSGRVVWCVSDYTDWVSSRVEPPPIPRWSRR